MQKGFVPPVNFTAPVFSDVNDIKNLRTLMKRNWDAITQDLNARLWLHFGTADGDIIFYDVDGNELLRWDESDDEWLFSRGIDLGVTNTALGRGANPGYLFGGRLIYAADDTFDKGDYPGLRAIDVQCQGAGGGAGSAPATTGAQISASQGGSSGAYSRSFILVSDLDTSEAITVGARGAAGTGGGNGGTGGTTTFDTISGNVSAPGGPGGQAMAAGTADSLVLSNGAASAGTGDFTTPGQPSEALIRVSGGSRTGPGNGAKSFLGVGGQFSITTANNGEIGGGGGGVRNSGESSAKNGGQGGAGLVIVELYF